MRISIFTKLFITYTLFVLVPIIALAGFIILSYGQNVEHISALANSPTFFGTLFLALATMKIQIMYLLILVIFLSMAGTYVMARIIIAPLQNIMRGLKEVGNGNLGFKIDVRSGDELGQSGENFNKMVSQLKKANLIVAEKRDVLEVVVATRTKELEHVVKTMEETIRHHTKELQGRIVELEKIQKLSVGRELKMTELKNEIKNLQKPLGLKNGD